MNCRPIEPNASQRTARYVRRERTCNGTKDLSLPSTARDSLTEYRTRPPLCASFRIFILTEARELMPYRISTRWGERLLEPSAAVGHERVYQQDALCTPGNMLINLAAIARDRKNEKERQATGAPQCANRESHRLSILTNYENRVLFHKLHVPAIKLSSRTPLRTAIQPISIPSGGTTARTPSHTKTPVAAPRIA